MDNIYYNNGANKIYNKRTDLAVEAHQIASNRVSKNEIDGVKIDMFPYNDVEITHVNIISEEGVKTVGKPIGNYITIKISSETFQTKEAYENLCTVISEQIKKVVSLNEEDVVLVVGLGNWQITPDSLGPNVVSKLMITRHLIEYVPEEIDEGVRPVCSIAPGVLGITGIETTEIVKGIVEKVKPKLVIAVDALAAMEMHRVNTTVQITDTGIIPGSGVGNKRKEITKNTMGVPVIAIGVPTVVDVATMTNNTIDRVIENLVDGNDDGSHFYSALKQFDTHEKHQIIQKALEPNDENFIVTPREIDDIINNMSDIIANSINLAIHEGIGIDDIDRFLN